MVVATHVPKWTWRWTAVSALFVSLLYLAFVYRAWSDISELVLLVPLFVCLALSVGFVFSALPVSRPFTVTFLATAPAPLISFLIALLGYEFIRAAHAGPASFDIPFSDTSMVSLHVFFFLPVGLAFAGIACFGCMLGMLFQRAIVKATNIANRGNQIGEDAGIRVAAIGANATIAAGVIAALGSVFAAVLG